MKRHFVNLFSFVVGVVIVGVAMLSGCQTPEAVPGSTARTPQQIAAAICPDAGDMLVELLTLNGLTELQRERLQQASAILARVCTPGAIPSKVDLTTILQQGAPFAIDVINASDLPVDKKNNLILGVMAIKIIANHYLNAMQALN